MNPDELSQLLKERFPKKVAWVLTSVTDLDFYGVLKQDEGTNRVRIFMNPYKDFEVDVKATEEVNGQLVLISENESWTLRKLDPLTEKDFLAGVRKAGVDV